MAFIILIAFALSCKKEDATSVDDTLFVLSKTINGAKAENGAVDVDTDVEIELIFSHTLNTGSFEPALSFTSPSGAASFSLAYSNTNSTVTIVNTAPLENETVYTVAVSPGAWGAGGEELKEPFSLSFTTEPFVPANVTLSADVASIDEAGGTATVTATLSDPLDKDVTVVLAFGGTAMGGGLDYTVSATSVAIPAGEASASITIDGVQDNEIEGIETIEIAISSIENAVEITPQEISIAINDDDIDSNGDGVPDQGFLINEVLFDPPSGDAGDANGDGTRSASEDEFIEFVNDSGQEVDLSGYTLFDEDMLAANEPRHTFPPGTVIPPGGVYVLFGGGSPSGDFGGALVGVSTTGNMNLNNAGDRIIIKDEQGNIFLTFDTSTDGAGLDFGSDQSVTRSPDINGGFKLHTDANSALLFSPGTKADGSNFSGGGGDPGLGFLINEVLFDPPSGDAGDANGDGTRSASEDEFIEFVNDSDQEVDLSGYTLFDEDMLAANEPRHIFPPGTVIPPGGVYVLFGGGMPSGDFGGAMVGVATTGNMNLNNAGDMIVIKDEQGNVFLAFDTATDGAGLDFGADQSVTRSPDIEGDFTLHTDANSALLFSPGTRTDGTGF
ncbi:MAG: lamin tail domain-containing protein [Phaeodactylibacter sp.]|nr:lamin tail domain-containing protein [Phaeodactylibacter sp.]